jgi:hypothetical protein
MRASMRAYGGQSGQDRTPEVHACVPEGEAPQEAKTSVAAGPQTEFQLLFLPLYMVGQTSRLCQTVLRNKAD